MVHAVCFRFSAANVFVQGTGTFLVSHGKAAFFDCIEIKRSVLRLGGL